VVPQELHLELVETNTHGCFWGHGGEPEIRNGHDLFSDSYAGLTQTLGGLDIFVVEEIGGTDDDPEKNA